ncbi:Ebp2-domain-containing protein [Daldinia caldariorum]|uniref:Ebp2-domain-containing protein n=1 Tax=Daldinia caldariorum TaxID=326644 RepID=UPI00200812B4|nr:Ebp2-domain-containing protein [Daldinia caldariorum]KAI1469774.1 Ebp2-domain-containing protein [Daldinia caldariorum]
MGKSKLKVALAAEKGVDFKKLKEKKKHKERIKKRQEKEPKNGGADREEDGDWEGVDEDEDKVDGDSRLIDDEAEEDSEEEDNEEGHIDFEALDESDSSDSSIDLEEKIERPRKSALKANNAKTNEKKKKNNADEDEHEEEEEEEEEDDEDIPMSDLEDLPDEEKEDLVPHSRLTINNTSALLASLNRIAIPTDKSVPFATHQSIVSAEPTADGIEDIQDDLKRELAFYAQSLDAAKRARALLKAEGVPFSRPTDYFAEMVKDDGHMEKVKAKLIEEASAKKASAEARKQRDLKKFGKQVQVAKLQERQKAKRETLEKIKTLKRKRQESSGDLGTSEADLFDVGVDNELSKHNAQRAFSRGKDGERAGAKRQKKNEKYGFGGKKRHAKSGDALSSGDLSSFNPRKMKAGGAAGAGAKKGGKPVKPRLGKSRRNAGKR